MLHRRPPPPARSSCRSAWARYGRSLATDVFRVRPEREPGCAEDVIADGELTDLRTDRFDHSGELTAEDPAPRPADAKDGAADERDRQTAAPIGVTRRTVQPVHGRGEDLDEDLVV